MTNRDLKSALRVVPITWRGVAIVLLAFVLMTTVSTITGFAVVEWVQPSPIGEAETDFSEVLEDHRSEQLNDLATLGSLPSDIPVKIGLVAVLLIAMPLLLRRWHDWVFLASGLFLEVNVYGLSSYLVGRERPPVERLATSRPESWPSGHVAAALTFYVGLAIVVGWHAERTWIRVVAWVSALAIVVIVAASRLYLGMHYLSDVAGGLILGAVSLLVAKKALEVAVERIRDQRMTTTPAPPPQTMVLDLTRGGSGRS